MKFTNKKLFFAVLSAAVLVFTSCCSSTKQVVVTSEVPAVEYFPQEMAHCKDGVYDWENGSVQLYPQVRYMCQNVYIPRIMKIHAMRIDISDPAISFAAPLADPDAGKPMPDCPKFEIVTKRATTSNFMKGVRAAVAEGGRGLNMIVAVNADPWKPWESPWNHKYACGMGLIVNEGKLVSPGNGRPSFIVGKDGKCRIENTPEGYDISNVEYAVSGFQTVLANGELITENVNNEVLAPRTGYGISADGKYIVFLVIDGRQPNYSMGSTVQEVGRLLKCLGCSEGLNMDGGGSTTLVYLDARGNIVQCNHQSGGAVRSNGANFGIILK